MRQAIKGVDDLRRLVGDLTERVEALEAAQTPEDDAEDKGLFGRWRRRRPQGEGRSDG